MANPKRGDIIYVKRYGGIYEHYGIFINSEKVIHRKETGVERTTLADFCKDSSKFHIERSANPDLAVKRAISRLGEPGYNLVTNNCEHFARWCHSGKEYSVQADNIVIGAAVVGVGAAIGIGLGILGDLLDGSKKR